MKPIEIIKKQQRGGLSLSTRFNHAPVIKIGTSVVFSTDAVLKLRARKGDAILFGKSDGKYYVAVTSGTINDNGYKLSGRNKTDSLFASIPKNIKNDIKPGFYFISTKSFDGKYDWFELEKTNDNE